MRQWVLPFWRAVDTNEMRLCKFKSSSCTNWPVNARICQGINSIPSMSLDQPPRSGPNDASPSGTTVSKRGSSWLVGADPGWFGLSDIELSWAGRDLIIAAQKSIEAEFPGIQTYVTLSPKTEMARRFHLKNGARELRENPNTINYIYK